MQKTNTLLDNYQDAIIWLDNYNCELTEITYCEAAYNGYLEIMKILYDKGVPFDKYGNVWEGAAMRGHIKILEWLYEKECPMSKTAISDSVIYDKPDAFKWFYNHNFPFTLNTLERAAKKNNIEINISIGKNGTLVDIRD